MFQSAVPASHIFAVTGGFAHAEVTVLAIPGPNGDVIHLEIDFGIGQIIAVAITQTLQGMVDNRRFRRHHIEKNGSGNFQREHNIISRDQSFICGTTFQLVSSTRFPPMDPLPSLDAGESFKNP
ncbi:hypothetical protein P691DRAFT_781784 [Macrolepiota fuliginosa MF-IS2]|uniref:Uncharacterized protein n=1 Tax=Macrolepiota fuliginosa MF-IS2 TaxID=1400762 RepID=A0A9P5X0F9_9AGAR|nr:hypothetical protein P691DRAFT_781784 [Macrolepiota fuliginosa MF-IS2]